jgi:hypothetical protein
MLEMYRQQIGASLLRIDELMEERKKIDAELVKLRKLALANAFMLTDQDARDAVVAEIDSQSATGFTHTIRSILRQNPRGLTPPEIRDALFGAGYDLSSQVNPLASIHSVLRRLVTAGEVEPLGESYRWKGDRVRGFISRAFKQAAIIERLKSDAAQSRKK